MEQPQRGRPPADNPRDKVIKVYMSAADALTLKAVAMRAGLGESQWARSVLLREMERLERTPKPDPT